MYVLLMVYAYASSEIYRCAYSLLYSREQDVSIKYVYKATFNVTSAIKKEIYQIRYTFAITVYNTWFHSCFP